MSSFFAFLEQKSPLASMNRSFVAIKTVALPFLFAALNLFAPSAAEAKNLSGVVTHVTDGDTLWVRTSARGEPRKVRMQGIDAPESCQAWGPQASQALKARALGQTVQLSHKGGRVNDDYGRLLARVNMGSEDLGQWMVANGHAWSYHYRRDAGPYVAEQNQAQASRRGLWSAGNAVEPRVFRKQHGSCKQ